MEAIDTTRETAPPLPEALGDLVREHARSQPGEAAFAFGDEVLTFGALDAGSNRAANGLAALGLGKGDRIAYLGKNHPLYFELLIAAAKLGAVMTPVNWRLTPPEVAYIVNDCQAKILVVGEGFAEMLATVRPDLTHVETLIGLDAGDAALTDYRHWRDGFAASDPQAIHVLIRDQAGFHLRDGDARLPERVRLVDLPPYSPELNPCEQFWDLLKDDVCNKVYKSVAALRRAMKATLRRFWDDATSVVRLIGREWLKVQLNAMSKTQESV